MSVKFITIILDEDEFQIFPGIPGSADNLTEEEIEDSKKYYDYSKMIQTNNWNEMFNEVCKYFEHEMED